MDLHELWAALDSCVDQLGGLSERQIKHFLRNFSPKTFIAIQKAEGGDASGDEMRAASRFFSYYMDHRRYEKILRLYDASLTFSRIDYRQSKFVGRGGGRGSLASYRKVRLSANGTVAFEKIYSLGSRDFRATRWFHCKIFSQLQNGFPVAIPQLLAKRKGASLAVFYYEYIHGLRSFDDADSEDDIAVSMSASYAKILNSFNNLKASRALSPIKHSDFRIAPYLNGRKNASLFLTSKEQSKHHLSRIESFLLAHPGVLRVFSHGDLSTENFFVNGLIDFDNCGWYPKGFDLALMLSLSKLFDSIQSLREWATDRCGLSFYGYVDQLSFLFFCFIFYVRRKKGVVASDDWLLCLWGEVLWLAREAGLID